MCRGKVIVMDIRLDHIVLWTADPLRAVEFYEQVLGLEGVRVEDFRAGKAAFPSVRVNADTILDLTPPRMVEGLNAQPGMEGSAGNKVNHLCLALGRIEYDALRDRLAERGIPVPMTVKDNFGARGMAPEAIYFADPDGNVIEARYYD